MFEMILNANEVSLKHFVSSKQKVYEATLPKLLFQYLINSHNILEFSACA